MLVGRESEVSRLDEMAAILGSGMSSVLVVRGEAGVGKSTLLDYFAAATNDYR